MNQQDIEKLIALKETDKLDFKSEIDLDTKRGQIDFLVEMLGLANNEEKPTYLVLGVQDDPRKVVGVDEKITEERLQKFVNDNLKNPLHFTYETYPYKRKDIGVITILGKKRPYTLKKTWDYADQSGKQHRVSDKQVQVRRGSTGDIATIEEVIEMATKHVDNSDITEELNEISSSIYRLGRNMEWPSNDRDRSIEYLFVGIVSAVAITSLQTFGWKNLLISSLLLPFMINIVASALKIVRFGLVRSFGVGIIISIAVLFLTSLESFVYPLFSGTGPALYTQIMLGCIKGVIGGLVADYFISKAEM